MNPIFFIEFAFLTIRKLWIIVYYDLHWYVESTYYTFEYKLFDAFFLEASF